MKELGVGTSLQLEILNLKALIVLEAPESNPWAFPLRHFLSAFLTLGLLLGIIWMCLKDHDPDSVHNHRSFWIVFSTASLKYYKRQNYKDIYNPGILGEKKVLEIKKSE